jgi:PAS domain S-box-containing protein
MNGMRKILVVEDENIVALDIKNRLKALGYEVPAIAHTGEQAIAKVKESRPDLVLMDIMLKGKLDGIETSNLVREKFDIPVIYLTAYADQSTFERAKITEPYGYILKPFEERELYTSIEMALYKHSVESRLKQREQWLSTTLKSIGDAVIATDLDHHITFMNSVAENLTGFSSAEVLGKKISDVLKIHSLGKNGITCSSINDMIYTGESIKLENSCSISSKNGKEILIDINISPIQDERKNSNGSILVFRDVGERHSAQMALKESEEKFRRITNSAYDAIIMIDGNERITYWNRAAENIFGYSQAELLGEGVFKLLSTTTSFQETLRQFREMRKGEKGRTLSTFELMAVRKDGTEFPIELSLSAVKIKGELNGVAVIRDITERKRSEKALKLEKERAELLYKVVPSAIFTTDISGRVTSFNDKASEILGYPPEEVINKHCSLFGIEKYCSGCEIKKGETLVPKLGVECEVKRKDGKIRIISKNADMLKDPNGVVIGYIQSFEDITERKQAELELQKAKEAAEAATRAKSEFLANMSHEIRTPMNAVIGMTGLLLCSELNEEQREYVETVRKSGEDLLTIINDILDFSKIESGKMKLENQPFNLRDCIEECIDLHASQASDKKLELGYIIADETPQILKGDVTRLRQILNNLLSNAVKFTNKGEIFVQVGSKKLSNNQHRIHFSVKDTGIGIPQEKINQLFQSFTQVDASITRKFGGTGLGLAISRHLTALMGGKMWVESEEGKGSIFHFDIIAADAGDYDMLSESLGKAKLTGKRILIVDDNATNRKVISMQAKSFGMITTEVESAQLALALLEDKHAFDIALLDMQMPGMDGMTLAKKIKSMQNGEALPLIMLSSVGSQDKRKQNGLFSAFLVKPIRQQQLYNALTRVFGNGVTSVDHVKLQFTIDSEMAKKLPLRILLAEDNPVNQKLATRILNKLGYRAEVAGNGLEVLQALERQPYDIVLMDVQMPEMDGLEATKIIKRNVNGKQQPYIIAMTALAMEGDRERCMEAGMDDYISKPIRVDELIASLENSQSQPQEPSGAVKDQQSAVSALDKEVLSKLRRTLGEDDEQVFIELIDIFLDDAPKLIDEMEQSFKKNELKNFIRAAHTLKTSSATVGAMTLSSYCKELELSGREDKLENVADRLKRIKQNYELVKKGLKEITESLE